MRCPYCGYEETRVLDTRPTLEGRSIRRRRECAHCGRRFTTFETIEALPLVVIKQDGSREPFDKEKIIRGLMRASVKRPVSLETMQAIADLIEREARGAGLSEIPSTEIGEAVLKHLLSVDEVAYVRFASVYRQFSDVHGFMKELEGLLKRQSEQSGKN
ncbi:MAG: transcriptional repressor NrdR [Candidatus Carbobacillus altaicus]|uniref:Transcriptional repressor NrdR n=1 Tax=Candidatus Carbonibacillus altaicus TaxID=2163959 RepID=A0A2R6XZS0_9BACL|nr:transcriptional repressor NrdR [Candidatus Carbobacillus altaicus]PTQ55921.1 MAG: Ribonucleotide reductase transcriptional regulator NrdR [Candidatus Carbobacillus altaicus]